MGIHPVFGNHGTVCCVVHRVKFTEGDIHLQRRRPEGPRPRQSARHYYLQNNETLDLTEYLEVQFIVGCFAALPIHPAVHFNQYHLPKQEYPPTIHNTMPPLNEIRWRCVGSFPGSPGSPASDR
jgi:hypothetical protein